MEKINIYKLSWSDLISLKQEIEREILLRLARNDTFPSER